MGLEELDGVLAVLQELRRQALPLLSDEVPVAVQLADVDPQGQEHLQGDCLVEILAGSAAGFVVAQNAAFGHVGHHYEGVVALEDPAAQVEAVVEDGDPALGPVIGPRGE